MPVQAKLAAAWTSLMFFVMDIDYYHLYKPGAIDQIRGGRIFEFDISGTLLTIFVVVIGIPALMIVLSMTLPARLNRVTNLVVASLQIPLMIFNAVGESWEWASFYGLSIGSVRGADPGLHPALRLDLARPHAAAGVTARPAPDHPSLAPPAGTVTCLSVRC